MDHTMSVCEPGNYVPGINFVLWFQVRLAKIKLPHNLEGGSETEALHLEGQCC